MSSLAHDNVRTAGLPTAGMHACDTDNAFHTIQENSVATEPPGDLFTCQSTPTLHGANGSAPAVSPSTGPTVAGGCHTAIGNREGTPAFGAVDGLDSEPGSCTGTDCSMTPELSAVEVSPVRKSASITGDVHAVSGTVDTQQAGAVEHAPSMTVSGGHEDGSPGDLMISPNWLQSDAEIAKTVTCADGNGGFGSPVGPGAPWTGFDAMHATRCASLHNFALCFSCCIVQVGILQHVCAASHSYSH